MIHKQLYIIILIYIIPQLNMNIIIIHIIGIKMCIHDIKCYDKMTQMTYLTKQQIK